MAETCTKQHGSCGPGYASPREAMLHGPREKILYVNCVHTDADKPDALVTVDVDPSSPTYCQIIHKLSMREVGDELHHSGWNICSSCHGQANEKRDTLVLPCLMSDRIYFVDLTNEREPKIKKILEPEEMHRHGVATPHAVHCAPTGEIMISVLGNPRGDALGDFLRIDSKSLEIQGTWTRGEERAKFGYDFWYQPYHDALIATEWGVPNVFKRGFASEDIEGLGNCRLDSLVLLVLASQRHDHGHSHKPRRQVPVLLKLAARGRAPIRHQRSRPTPSDRADIFGRQRTLGLEGPSARGSGVVQAARAALHQRPSTRWLAADAAAQPGRQETLREILTIISKDEEQWWTARNSLGQTGSVPVPYVQKYNEDHHTIESLPARPESGGSSGSGTQISQTDSIQTTTRRANIQRTLPAFAKVKQARVPNAYDKTALKLEVGDIIKVTKTNINGQWEGELHGKVGHFPFTHVEFVDDETNDDSQEV
ncbi:unnamed protein product [Trichogramma brassicae]|uniref:SH3 domain-containing protein n=1 Tax=Trichogramma brassicae TaxID=86971 RepID=A0A6H5IWF6_9HYME|nr:unnamed protein product [Trichogramma brassicae]